ncbi:phage tail tape measure protein [Puniceicoccus vermicola]|uniref:Phage tail tape measure protein n=1 Tax=Puniceicoccus vermicola TaxID=388746 RepID=A0A7X1E5M9_9BACT|nr:phage tail tape measure protein [Puniceicoccus vermicola]MBC2601762.1 phage tail tape measure protein [Puniceicoccus vermicola]
MNDSIIAHFGGNTRNFDRAADKVEKRGKGLARTMKGLFAGAAAGFAVGKLGDLVDYMDRIGKKADTIGITTDALQELRAAGLKKAGIEAGTTDMALQRFNRRLAEARNGSGEAKKAFAEMGIELRDREGNAKSFDDILYEVADGLRDTREESDRLRLAFKFFDSEGAAFVNVLEDGSKSLRKLRNDMSELSIESEMIKDAEELKDQLTEIGLHGVSYIAKTFKFAADAGESFGDIVNQLTGDIDDTTLSLSEMRAELAEQSLEWAQQDRLRAEQIKQAKELKEKEREITLEKIRQREEMEMQNQLAKLHDAIEEARERRNKEISDNLEIVRKNLARVTKLEADREMIRAQQEGGTKAVIALENKRAEKLEGEIRMLREKGRLEEDSAKRAEIGVKLTEKQLELEKTRNRILSLNDPATAGARGSGGSVGTATTGGAATSDLSSDQNLREAVKARAEQEEDLYFQRENTPDGKGFREFREGKKGRFFTDEEMRDALEKDRQKSKTKDMKKGGGGGGNKAQGEPAWQKAIVSMEKRLGRLESKLQ